MKPTDYGLRDLPNYGGEIKVIRKTIGREGYDRHGEYFGVGSPLFSVEEYACPAGVWDAGFRDGFIRAPDYATARAVVKGWYPKATVLR